MILIINNCTEVCLNVYSYLLRFFKIAQINLNERTHIIFFSFFIYQLHLQAIFIIFWPLLLLHLVLNAPSSNYYLSLSLIYLLIGRFLSLEGEYSISVIASNPSNHNVYLSFDILHYLEPKDEFFLALF